MLKLFQVLVVSSILFGQFSKSFIVTMKDSLGLQKVSLLHTTNEILSCNDSKTDTNFHEIPDEGEAHLQSDNEEKAENKNDKFSVFQSHLLVEILTAITIKLLRK